MLLKMTLMTLIVITIMVVIINIQKHPKYMSVLMKGLIVIIANSAGNKYIYYCKYILVCNIFKKIFN